jgi:outer membrane protein OmpA-like peptidoglycan-associated protein
MKPSTYLIIIACAGLLVGCATAPPAELINARQAYQQASAGQAAQLVPAELHKAQEALAIAEKSFQDDPKSFRTRDLAYIADRKAKMAEALATTVAENATTAKANKDYQATQTEILKHTKEDLAASERSAVLKTEQLAAAAAEVRRIKDSTDAEVRRVKQQADANVEAQRVKELTNAEARRIKDSTDAEVRRVKQQADANVEAQRIKDSTNAEARRIKDSTNAEARRLAEQKSRDTLIVFVKGTTVVLKGVNFEFNKATLTKDSEKILWRAYNAMVANPNVRVVITGHTDNVGSQESNNTLSLKRAQAVKNWLVKTGIASNRMRTVGRGQNEPMSSNETDAGRAENRRIEFFVQ